MFKFKNIILKPINCNLVDKVWLNKPKERIKKFFFLPDKISGKSVNKKILELKKYLIKSKYDLLFVSAPENVSWILNIRGNDNLFSPVTNAKIIDR